MHPFIPVLSPSFLYHPYIPSFKSKDFSFTCLLSFFAAHCILNFMLWWIYCLGLFIVVYTHVVFMSCCRKCVMYVCQLSLLQLLIWAGYRHFKERLPEAICCCLQTCNVDVVLLVMYCMHIPAFIVTSADISQLWVYLCYLLIYCLRLFVVVYKLVMFMERGWHCIAYVYKFSWSLVLTSASYRYI